MTKKNTEAKIKKQEKGNLVETGCKDIDCPIHGKLKLRGKTFKGKVIKKFPRRITIELEKIVYIPKYERYLTKKSKHHARLPDCMEKEINIGDTVKIKECRPLSKIVNFAVSEKLNSKEEEK